MLSGGYGKSAKKHLKASRKAAECLGLAKWVAHCGVFWGFGMRWGAFGRVGAPAGGEWLGGGEPPGVTRLAEGGAGLEALDDQREAVRAEAEGV